MGSNLIVIGTLIFLFISAVLLVLMTYSMSKKVVLHVDFLKFFKAEIVVDNRPEKLPKNKKRKDDGGAENPSQQTD